MGNMLIDVRIVSNMLNISMLAISKTIIYCSRGRDGLIRVYKIEYIAHAYKESKYQYVICLFCHTFNELFM